MRVRLGVCLCGAMRCARSGPHTDGTFRRAACSPQHHARPVGKSPLDAARLELEEEAHLQSETWIPLLETDHGAAADKCTPCPRSSPPTTAHAQARVLLSRAGFWRTRPMPRRPSYPPVPSAKLGLYE